MSNRNKPVRRFHSNAKTLYQLMAFLNKFDIVPYATWQYLDEPRAFDRMEKKMWEYL